MHGLVMKNATISRAIVATKTPDPPLRCSGCKKYRPVEAFGRCKRNGRQRYCRDCHRAAHTRYRRAHGAQPRQIASAWPAPAASRIDPEYLLPTENQQALAKLAEKYDER
jgi:hypothetical protein